MVFNGSIRGFHPLGIGSNPVTRSKLVWRSSIARSKQIDHLENVGWNPTYVEIFTVSWSSGLRHSPVTREIASSNLAGIANFSRKDEG